jgi:hypothetical protein
MSIVIVASLCNFTYLRTRWFVRLFESSSNNQKLLSKVKTKIDNYTPLRLVNKTNQKIWHIPVLEQLLIQSYFFGFFLLLKAFLRFPAKPYKSINLVFCFIKVLFFFQKVETSLMGNWVGM